MEVSHKVCPFVHIVSGSGLPIPTWVVMQSNSASSAFVDYHSFDFERCWKLKRRSGLSLKDSLIGEYDVRPGLSLKDSLIGEYDVLLQPPPPRAQETRCWNPGSLCT